jgi:hypothetical protein
VYEFGLREGRHVPLAFKLADGYLMQLGQYFVQQGIYDGLIALHK